MELLDRALAIVDLLAMGTPLGPPAGTGLPPAAEVEQLICRWMVRLQLERPAVPEGEDEPPDPRQLAWWLLRMAGETCRRAREPLPTLDPGLVERFVALTCSRPRELEEHAQLHIDAPSTLRRALAVREQLRCRPGPVLAVGDDDGVTLALALLGVTGLHAVDVDERLLEFIEGAGASVGAEIRVGCVDVFEDPVPLPWRGAFSAVITDPIRSYEPCLAFLRYAADGLARDEPAGLFWADHPDWNFDHARVVATLPELGLRLAGCTPLLHTYPLTSTWVTDLGEKAATLGVDVDWLVRLADAVAGWSHLYVLSPAAQAAAAQRR